MNRLGPPLRSLAGVAVAVVLVGSLSVTGTASARSTAVAFPTVGDPSGLAATTTLTFSRSHADHVMVAWPDSGDDPSELYLTVRDYLGDQTGQLDSSGISCNGATCTWSGDVEEVSSGDTAHVDVRRLVNGGTDIQEELDRWHGALLPADTEKPVIKVKIPKRTVTLGKVIRLKVSFSDNQTEFGWDNDDCAPGGDCYHPDWYPMMSLNKGKKWTYLTDQLFSSKPRTMRVWIKWPDEALNMSKVFKSPRLTWKKRR